tara:strand:+ start:6745 stop:7680 length:936 start_codon:yes stop_codon:yes gene_type:complete
MGNISGASMKKLVSILLLCCLKVAFADPYQSVLYSSLSSGKVFYQSTRQHKMLELVSGEIQYLRTENGAEGYQAQQVLQFEAQSSVRIVDHKPGTTILPLYRDVERQLERLKFETLYRCDYLQCGDISGWQLYLSDKLLGKEDTQHYLLAKATGPGNAEYYAQFYIVELDDQPRSFLRLVGPVSSPFQPADQAVDDDRVSLFFLYDSTHLLEQSRRELTALAAKIQRDKVSKVVITGHADSHGAPAYNCALAMRRADHVAAALKSQAGLDSLHIERLAQGEASPYADNRFAAGREQNRRVTVQLLGPNPQE